MQRVMQAKYVHPTALGTEELLRHCEVIRTRGQGPGGQHRNKVETAIVLVHKSSGVRGEASERRSQRENHRVALQRLRVNLALAVRSEVETQGRDLPVPSEVWQSRTKGGRIVVSSTHDDFAALLAEALDAIEQQAFDVASAAERLSVSSSQLIKLLRMEPRALGQVNDRRASLGLKRLR